MCGFDGKLYCALRPFKWFDDDGIRNGRNIQSTEIKVHRFCVEC